MDDLILTRLVFAPAISGNDSNADSKIVRLQDAKSDFHEAFESENSSWNEWGIKILKIRRATSVVFNNAAKVLDHAALMRNALRQQLQLANVPQCIETTILYGEINPLLADMDISQVGAMTITVHRGMPSSWAKTDANSEITETLLRRFYRDAAFECLKSRMSAWELIEVVHPISQPMNGYPLVFRDPRASSNGLNSATEHALPSMDSQSPVAIRHSHEQRWLCMVGQQPCEVLVRRVASSDEGARICGPLVSSNITGDLLVVPEDRMSLKFVVWR